MDIAVGPEALRIVETPDQSLLGRHGVDLCDEMRQPESCLTSYADLVALEPQTNSHIFDTVINRRIVRYLLLRGNLPTELIYAGKLDQHRSEEIIEPEFQLAQVEPVLLRLLG